MGKISMVKVSLLPMLLFAIISPLKRTRHLSSAVVAAFSSSPINKNAKAVFLGTFQNAEPSLRGFDRIRLFGSGSEACSIEISPNNHGTTPLENYLSDDELHPLVKKCLQKQGIDSPTPIQAHGIPLLRQGLDVMGSAATGTGKTIFFSVPLVEKLLRHQANSQGPKALILNPTRELALQTAAAIRDLTDNKLQVGLATGGASVAQQRKQIGNSDIIVATPGRLLQFIDDRSLSLRNIQSVVCDESDRMVDLGFEPQLRRIAKALGRSQENRQTVLCSATFPLEVQRIASDFLKPEYFFIAVGRVGETHSRIEQEFLWLSNPEQKRMLASGIVTDFLASSPKSEQSQVIVFCNTKEEAESVGAKLRKTSQVRVVTGDKSQEERNRSLEQFRKGQYDVLVATDVASRGLDVPSIGLVVQVDAPRDSDTFVHRIGRTGRAGATGKAVTFLDSRSLSIASELLELLGRAGQPIPAWLRGMSHVKKAREMEEEAAIRVGGGMSVGLLGNRHMDEEVNSNFSDQDFRKTAESGSWGAGRDASYSEFENDAYGPWEASGTAGNQNLSTAVDPVADASGENLFQTPETSTNQHDDWFSDTSPSKELEMKVEQLTGDSANSDRPSKAVYKQLCNRGIDQQLRFEYLGLFPFSKVSQMLSKEERDNDNEKMGDERVRVLMVAEKPSIAKAIADALSGPKGPRQKRGISRALPVHELTTRGFSLPGEGSNNLYRITVTSVVGHVFSLGFKDHERGAPDQYFHLPVVKQEEGSTGKLRIVDHLRALAGDTDHLVLCLDADAEGENIAYEVIGVARRAMEEKMADPSSLNRIHRARFSAITPEALRAAFKKLEAPDPLLSKSVDARQELDLRVGVAFTRFLTWKCVNIARNKFLAATRVVSYGPCQFPALSFCVDRAREIEGFRGKDFWTVQVSARHSNGSEIKLRWIPPDETRVATERKSLSTRGHSFIPSSSFDQKLAESAFSLGNQSGASISVTQVDTVIERMDPPLPLNTIALLSAGSKAMGMSPKKVMQVAEKLYGAGYISYPRTESTKYDPKGFDVRRILKSHLSHPSWGQTASFLSRTKYKDSGRPPVRGRDFGDHPPITCLKPATREQIGGGAEWRVYEFIARTFLGSLSDSLVFDREVAQCDLGGHSFEAEQVRAKSLGFAGACPWVLKDIGAELKQKSNSKQEIKLREGIDLSIIRSKLEHLKTRPPSFLQEHELIQLMDTHSIGTDASVATHVNNIVERGYVVLCDENGVLLRPPRPPRPGQKPLPRQIGRYLVPTSLGMELIKLFESTNGSSHNVDQSPVLLTRPAIRAQMEHEVKQIAIGEIDKDECLKQNLKWFEQRYGEFAASLTRDKVNEFGRQLRPVKDSLRYWQKLGAFEEKQNVESTKTKVQHGNSSAREQRHGKKSGKRANYSRARARSR